VKGWCGHGMQEVRGSCLPQLHDSILGALCPMRARGLDRGHRLAAKLHVSGPTGGEASAPSQGGSAGSNPVGATIGHHYNTVSDLEE
jgi:hypothetical protein